VKGCANGTKCGYLKNLSTTTMMTSFLFDKGEPSTKSSQTMDQGAFGTGNHPRSRYRRAKPQARASQADA